MFAWPLRPTTALDLAALASALVLATVHVVERFGWPPCELCLHEREVFWTALAIAVAGRALAYWLKLAPRVACLALAVAFGAGCALATYHAGVEWRWWRGPEACTGGAGAHVTAKAVADLFAGAGKTVHVVRCDEAAFRVLGLSLAGWNALLSAALAVLSFSALTSRSRA
jgi:disulfide bond formation protein DsbB